MCRLKLLAAGHLPVILAILLTFTLGLTYTVAVYRTDVDPFFPYLSTAGGRQPESCFFGLLLNISAFLSCVVIYLRYRLVAELNRGADEILTNLNWMSTLVAIIAFGGMIGVANFQETALMTVHLTSAFMCFGCSSVYFALQAVITVRMCPLYTGRRICWIRTVIALMSVITFAISVFFGSWATVEFHRYHPDQPTPHPWYRALHQPGYNLHVVSAIAEWLLVVWNGAFLLSFSRDFEKIRVIVDVHPLVAHLDENPISRSSRNSLVNTLVT